MAAAAASSGSSSIPQQDRTIIATADDAILAKLATVKAGYYDDIFLEAFSRHAAGITEQQQAHHEPRRTHRQVQPIIKRGTHARVCCMDRAITTFINYHHNNNNNNNNNQQPTTIQVVVLGCGKDTSYFRHARPHVHWYEVDHASVLHTKASIIQETPSIFASTVEKTSTGFCVTTTKRGQAQQHHNTSTICHLVEHDLRQDPKRLMDKLHNTATTTSTNTTTTRFDPRAPTLFLLECVLMYLPDTASRTLLQCLTQQCDNQNVYLCCYEPILGKDAFGDVMEQNLVKAGVAAPDCCLRTVRSLPAQLDKFVVDCGFVTAVGCDMSLAYETIMTPEQRTRANKSEFLDELEEWMLIMRHYCFIAASTSTDSDFSNFFCGIGPTSGLGFLRGKCTVKTRE